MSEPVKPAEPTVMTIEWHYVQIYDPPMSPWSGAWLRTLRRVAALFRGRP